MIETKYIIIRYFIRQLIGWMRECQKKHWKNDTYK